MTFNQNRVDAGLKSKVEGHDFENKVAQYTGGEKLNSAGNSKTKVDVRKNDLLQLSIKNTDKSSRSTQIHVGPLESFLKPLNFSIEATKALELFLGHTDPKVFLKEFKKAGGNTSKLSKATEINRHRAKGSSIPKALIDSLLLELNQQKKEIFNVIFSQGTSSFVHKATHMVVTVIKNDLESSLVYSMEELENIFTSGTWELSKTGSTIHLKYQDISLCRLQVKGSTETNTQRARKGLPPLPANKLKAFRTSYHYIQFQVHKPLFTFCKSEPIQSISKENLN